MTPMVPVLLNGRWPLLLPEHRAARAEWSTAWEKERLASMCVNVRCGDIVFDVGAEEGDISALLATWVGETGGVVLIEPNPLVWPNVRAIFESNALPPPLSWWVGFAAETTEDAPRLNEEGQRLIGRRDGTAWPECAFGPVIGDHGFRHLAQEADVTPRVALDDLCSVRNVFPDVVTMDVEGSELRVLRGMSDLLAHHRPLVYASVHPEFMVDLYGDRVSDLLSFVAGFSYDCVHLATDHEQHWAFVPPGRVLVAS